MEKKYSIIIGFILVLILPGLYLVFIDGILEKYNYKIEQDIDFSCNLDTDCKPLVHPEQTECNISAECDSYELEDEKVILVNKDWKPDCPFPKKVSLNNPYRVECVGGVLYDPKDIKCLNNKCVKYLD